MKVRALDSNHDWTFGKGKNNYKSDLDCIVQNIKTRLLQWKGNCFFDLNAGIDYINLLDIGTKDFLDRNIKQVVLLTQNVIIITNYESYITDRLFTCAITVNTIYGIATINMEL